MSIEPDDTFYIAITNFVECQNTQDLQGMLRLMHKESFAYPATQQVFMKLFAAFELRITLLHQAFIAIEGEYAYARIKIQTEKLTGPDFRNNITEFLLVFRLIGNTWKIWCQNPLSFQLL
ncbi:MAG: hypothetical protein V4628_07695 [Pseudomonadota bacterium]